MAMANTRAERAEAARNEERARADAADTDRRAALARADQAERDRDQERERADDLHDRLIAMQEQLADAHAALQEAEEAGARDERDRADRAEAATAAEYARADALRGRVNELQAGQELMMDMHARALAEAEEQLSRVREAAEGLRQAEQERRARGLLARLRAAVRGK